MGIEEILRSKREEILRLTEKHGAHNVRVFGVRGEAGPGSDIDLLIDLEAGRGLLEHAALLSELEDLLGRKVDVVTERGLRPRVRERVLSEAQPLEFRK
jgi:predicted nucleotidyltransferase